MSGHLNVEIKARCSNPEKLHDTLINLGADYKGEDQQLDTYFNCTNGRLKLRKGNIENTLIFYQRENSADAKSSHVELEHLSPENQLRSVLKASHGIKVEVDKKRRIYFIDNVKFHIDKVKGLGSFMEIEAIESEKYKTHAQLLDQCNFFINKLGIRKKDFIEVSYSDLLLESFEERIKREGKYFLKLIEDQLTNFKLSAPDHICFRTESESEYTELKKKLLKIGNMLVASEVGGREIATFKLFKSIECKDWSVSVIELAAPKVNSFYESGFEHAEFVISQSFKDFMDSYSTYEWDISAIDKAHNPEIRIRLQEGLSVKFHHQSLEKVIELEQK